MEENGNKRVLIIYEPANLGKITVTNVIVELFTPLVYSLSANYVVKNQS